MSEKPRSYPSLLPYAARLILVLCLYVALGKLGLWLGAIASGNVSPVWPPAGIALAALFRFGRGVLPSVFVGAFLVTRSTGAPTVVALSIALGNTAEALLGCYLFLGARARLEPALERLRDVICLALSAVCSPLVAATIGAAALWFSGVSPMEALPSVFHVWWVGDAVGILVVAPPLLAWSAGGLPAWSLRRIAEAVVLFSLLLASAGVVFTPWLDGEKPPLAFLPFPLILWASLRFGPRGATAATLLISFIAIVATTRGQGAFAHPNVGESLVVVQLYVGVMALTAMTLAASTAERRRALQMRDDFIAVASHELRTPLTAIRLRSQMLQRSIRKAGAESMSPVHLTTALDVITRQVERLSTLVDNLLDISRLDSGRLTMRREDVDLSALVREVVELMRDDAKRTGCRIELQEQAHPVGQWDRHRIEQVVTNLLGNALKYGKGHPVVIAIDARGDRASLSVRDQGIGIPREAQERIFERFERAVSTRHFGGFGLGLYIVQRVIEAHGGQIDVASEPGAGSTFRVELPLRPPAPTGEATVGGGSGRA